jgi:hypothetical protein
LLLFGQTQLFVLFHEIGTEDAAALQFGAFRFSRNDVPFLRVADNLRLVSAAG